MADFHKLHVDPGEISRLFADLPKITKQATAEALNITARKVNADLRKHISDTYNVPKSATKFGKLVSISRANATTDIGKAVIYIRVQGRGLMKYGAKQIASGVSVIVKRSAKTIKGAYISPIRKGSADKFVFRKGQGKHAGKVTRRSAKGTPYQADAREIMYGPQIAQLYTNRKANKIMINTINNTFQKELDRIYSKKFEKRR